jgi:hypothetical protein
MHAVLNKNLTDVAVEIGHQLLFTFENDGNSLPVLIKVFEISRNLSDYYLIYGGRCVQDFRSCTFNSRNTSNGMQYSVQIDNAQPNDAGTYYVRDRHGSIDGQVSYAECTVYCTYNIIASC